MPHTQSQSICTFLQQLNHHLEQNAHDPDFGIQDLCKCLFLSRSSLHRKITAATDKSISIYIRDFRLNKAYQLLKNNSYSIRIIALEVGFWDITYFNRCFKAKYHKTPTEIKNQPSS